jgi:type IV pilus assembly protein PilB
MTEDQQNITIGDTPERLQKKMREEIEAAKQVMSTQQKAKDLGQGKAKKVAGVIRSFQQEEEEKFIIQKAQKLNLPYINLMNYPVSPEVMEIIPKEIAQKYRVVPYVRAGKKIRIAGLDYDQVTMEVLKKLQDASGYEFLVSIASNSSIDFILKLYELVSPDQRDTEKISVSGEDESKFDEQISNLAELKEKVKTVSTTELIDVIMTGAVKIGASDIHIEPTETQIRLRYRLDGVLQDVAYLDKVAFKPLMSRLKYLSKLKLDVTDTPQDGRFSIEASKSKFDIRVSVLPTIYGESTVMRLLQQSDKFVTLSELGFPEDIDMVINNSIHKPNGLILNTGPTGSGKTTTLYAILQELNNPEDKIITLEDPVEYRIAGISQSQVNHEKGHTFSSGLRSILRQDPDIVLVGEIRDAETAEIATQASLTGHLVLSTLHTNNAAGAIPRLIEMGVKPYLIISSINLIIAQRLVRRICPSCIQDITIDPLMHAEMVNIFNKIPEHKRRGIKEVPTVFKQGQGCPKCNNTGYLGRIAILETFIITPRIEAVVLKELSLSSLQKAALEDGMTSMEQDGLMKAIQGQTTMSEVWSATKE